MAIFNQSSPAKKEAQAFVPEPAPQPAREAQPIVDYATPAPSQASYRSERSDAKESLIASDITIEGKTDVMQRKGAATRMARSAGAKKVVNRIQISDAARQKASDRLAKGRRRVQVKRGEARGTRQGRE